MDILTQDRALTRWLYQIRKVVISVTSVNRLYTKIVFLCLCMEEISFYGHGKLMLTAEYLVLDGATSLALPTKKGQHLKVITTKSHSRKLEWKSYTNSGELWFEALFDRNFQILFTSDQEKARVLQQMLLVCVFYNADFLIEDNYVEAETTLEFNREWGLGSSSTLIYCLASWAQIDPFILLKEAFSGSGYDIACAKSDSPILYKLNNKKPVFTPVSFKPSFSKNIWFVYLGKKQTSKNEVSKYSELEFNKHEAVIKADQITNQLIKCEHLAEFEELLEQHESLLSSCLNKPTIKHLYFQDYEMGAIKSLGAWGGDFVLVTGKNEEEVLHYFNSKGLNTIFSFNQLTL